LSNSRSIPARAVRQARFFRVILRQATRPQPQPQLQDGVGRRAGIPIAAEVLAQRRGLDRVNLRARALAEQLAVHLQDEVGQLAETLLFTWRTSPGRSARQPWR
jgi:hypothetical protein